MDKEKYIESDDLFDMGFQWFQSGNLDKAEICLKRSIELNPRFIYASVTLAEVLGAKNRFADAVQVLKKASRIDPLFDLLPFLIAKYSLEAGNFVSASKYIGLAIELSPGNEEYSALKEKIYVEKKDAGIN